MDDLEPINESVVSAGSILRNTERVAASNPRVAAIKANQTMTAERARAGQIAMDNLHKAVTSAQRRRGFENANKYLHPDLAESTRRAAEQRLAIKAHEQQPDPARMAYEAGQAQTVETQTATMKQHESVAHIPAPDSRSAWRKALDGLKAVLDPTSIAKEEKRVRDTAIQLSDRLQPYSNQRRQDPV